MSQSAVIQMNPVSFPLWSWFDKAIRVHEMSILNRFLRAFLGGLFLAFGSLLAQILSNDPWLSTNTPGLLKILEGLVFPIGLMMIVLFDADLLTSSHAVFTVATLKRSVPIYAWLVDWTIVFIGNLAGSLLLAGLVIGMGIFTNESVATYGASAVKFANTKMGADFGQILLRAIGCNMLVTIAVYQSLLMNDGISKLIATHFPIFAFVASGFDHVVANMYLIHSVLMVGGMLDFNTGTYIWKSLISSFIGNVIGSWIIAIPLYVLYSPNEFDPRRLNSTASSQDGTIADPPTHSNDKITDQWSRSVEAA